MQVFKSITWINKVIYSKFLSFGYVVSFLPQIFEYFVFQLFFLACGEFPLNSSVW